MSSAQSKSTEPHGSLKYLSLITLTVQNAALILWLRYVRTREDVDMFLSATAVVMAELFKCAVALLIILYQEKSIGRWLDYLHEHLIMNPMDNVKVSVPALVYVLQNNLQFIAVSNLDAATYQVCYQLKILTTALFSVVMLSKKLSAAQWVSLLVLMIGVAAVQIKPSDVEASPKHQNVFIGMLAVITSCLMSGFAGVYFEKILKGSVQSVWLRNVQLGSLGTVIGLVTLFLKDSKSVSEHGFFYGYDWAVWIAILLQSLGGLLVAVVVKYADNILKGFATSAAIVLSCIISMYFFDFHLTLQFAIGALLVITSVYIYGRYPYTPPEHPSNGLYQTQTTSKV
ncbi:UDP-N-acetylglucosamine transporter-like [Watersipora subatra]|uniref:UDP-N-acetylglucosamine transporter-like n=1 Tax=Watersipora subatra TaxID=2589382 RepID=UPI00355AE8EF